MTMRLLAIAVFSLACEGYGRSLQADVNDASAKQVPEVPLASLASFLLASNPALGIAHPQSAATSRPTFNQAVPSPQMADALTTRRSVVKYDTAKPVPEEVTNRALESAILAPNHFMSEPWRFYTCGSETKEKLRGLNEDKRKIAEGVPEMLVVTMASEHEAGEKLYYEDHAAVAAATQNFMLSLAAEGVGSKWMTGALGAPPEDVLAAVGAGSDERLMGVIWYGYPAKPLDETNAPKRKKGLEGVLKRMP